MRIRSLLLPVLFGALLSAGAAAATEVDTLLGRARQAESKGDMQTAERLMQSALVQEPTNPEPYVQLGDLYARQSESDYARFYYEEALTIDPQNVPAQTGLGKLKSNPEPSADTPLDKP